MNNPSGAKDLVTEDTVRRRARRQGAAHQRRPGGNGAWRVGLFLVVALSAGSWVRAGELAPAGELPPPVTHKRALDLGLEPLTAAGYEAGRELRRGLWDSPVVRLELTLARQSWPSGSLTAVWPTSPLACHGFPCPLEFQSSAQLALVWPGTRRWQQLCWQDKVATGVQTGLVVWALVEVARHAR